MAKRKNYSTELKAKVALEALKGEGALDLYTLCLVILGAKEDANVRANSLFR